MFAGMSLSIIFMILGYQVNQFLVRASIPTFNTYIGQLVTLLFIGLSLGFNISIGFEQQKKSYYFFAAFIAPIFIVGLVYSFLSSNFLNIALMVVGACFPYFYINSGIVAEHEQFYNFLILFTKYIPSWIIYTVGLNDFVFSILTTDALWQAVSYVISALVSIGLIWVITVSFEN